MHVSKLRSKVSKLTIIMFMFLFRTAVEASDVEETEGGCGEDTGTKGGDYSRSKQSD